MSTTTAKCGVEASWRRGYVDSQKHLVGRRGGHAITSGRTTRQPALDGVRAVAVALVLCFHAGFGWMRAGYLGVSVFFTLSGFLITRLLMDEHARTGRIALGEFYGRRFARLAPAGLCCLGLIVIARLFGAFRTVPHLGRDAVGALLQVVNWVKLGGDGSYADLFRGSATGVTSPLEHYWSLAIEEQFYWLWPIVLLAMLRRARRRGRSVLPALAITTAVCALAAPIIAIVFGADAAYWATPARLSEILVGACLACWVRARPTVPPAVRRGGPIAMATIVVLCVVLPSGRGLAYEGALPLFALLSGVAIWSLLADGPMRRTLSRGALPVIGRISYGLYLIHWPVDVLLRERGWDLASVGGFAVATSITFVLTVLSYRFVEMPVRLARLRPRRVFAMATTCTLLATAFVLVVLPSADPLIRENTELMAVAGIDTAASVAPLSLALAPTAVVPATTPTAASSGDEPSDSVGDDTNGDTSDSVGDDTNDDTNETVVHVGAARPSPTVGAGGRVVDDGPMAPGAGVVAATTSTVPTSIELPAAPSRPVRVLVVGDSTSLYLAEGLAAWSLDHPGYAQVAVRWCQGCGFILDGTITSFDGARFVADSNTLVTDKLADAVADLHPDIVVLMTTVDDVATREWAEREGPLSPTDLRFRARLVSAYSTLTDRVLALGVPQVAWVVPPTPTLKWTDDPAMRDAERWEVQHDVIRMIAAEHPADVGIVDLDGWFDAAGHTMDAGLRPDGVHMTDESAQTAAEQFVGPIVIGRALGLTTT